MGILKPKRPEYTLDLSDGVGTTDKQGAKPEPAVTNLEPEPVYMRSKKAKEKPPLPERFLNGGASAEEREAWVKENWGG